jgi:CPA2 family monovalent cation:H+ antiporter-2
MMLDLRLVASAFVAVLALFAALIIGKFALVAALSRAFGATPGTALRVGLALAQAGEFGFVLLALTSNAGIVPERFLQPLLAAMILSMLATPFLIQASDWIVMRLSRSEWMLRSLALHRVAVQSIEAERHVIILGYGRNGQRLARLLAAEGVRYVALDLDPERVREAAAAGDTVVFADSARREALIAAGLSRAAAVVVTFSDANAAVRVLAHVHELNPLVPVVVRARDEADIERLTTAGASEVVPEAFESGVMLASHTLVWLGVPLSRVMRRVAQVREEHYQLLRGLWRESGASGDETAPARLHTVTLDAQAHAVGRELSQLRLGAVQVRAVRRTSVRQNLSAADAGALQAGDVVVLLGLPDELAAAEDRLLRG